MNCLYCPHPAHPAGQKCSQCKCKAKPGFWAKLVDSLGNAIGNALGNTKFGGN